MRTSAKANQGLTPYDGAADTVTTTAAKTKTPVMARNMPNEAGVVCGLVMSTSVAALGPSLYGGRQKEIDQEHR